MDFDMYVKQKLFNTESTSSGIRREFLQRINATVIAMAETLKEKGQVSEEAVKKYISGNFALSRTNIVRYIEILKNRGIFDYKEGVFYLPELFRKSE